MTGLARVVGDVERFLDEHWSRGPRHRPEADAGEFADLLSLADVDHIISATLPRLPSFRLVRDGTPLDPARYTRSARLGGRTVSDVADPGRVYDEFRRGATIVLQALHRTWLPLTRFCRGLELELTHPVQANAYVTPPGARGLAVHYDTHDVFVLQLAGSKEWSVHEPVLDHPLPSQPWSAARGDPGPPCLRAELRAGDTLYVPRGFLHSARARQGISAHLTIGVPTQTWHDVVREALADLEDEVELRRSLPVGFALDETGLAREMAARLVLVRDRLEKVDLEAVAARVTRRFWANRPPVLTGQLQQLLRLDELDDSTEVRRREGAVCRVRVEGDALCVVLGDRELVMPAALEPVMRWIASSGPFRVGDLADRLDAASRRVLARRLVREGLLEVTEVD